MSWITVSTDFGTNEVFYTAAPDDGKATTKDNNRDTVANNDGDENSLNDNVNNCRGTVVYFGGDLQNSKENMKKDGLYPKYGEYCLENTHSMIQSKFPQCNVVTIKPSLINNHYSVFRNFLSKVDSMGQSIPILIDKYNNSNNDNNNNKNRHNNGKYFIHKYQCCAHLLSILLKLDIAYFPIHLVGFSRGVNVLTQLIYEFDTKTLNNNDQIKSNNTSNYSNVNSNSGFDFAKYFANRVHFSNNSNNNDNNCENENKNKNNRTMESDSSHATAQTERERATREIDARDKIGIDYFNSYVLRLFNLIEAFYFIDGGNGSLQQTLPYNPKVLLNLADYYATQLYGSKQLINDTAHMKSNLNNVKGNLTITNDNDNGNNNNDNNESKENYFIMAKEKEKEKEKKISNSRYNYSDQCVIIDTNVHRTLPHFHLYGSSYQWEDDRRSWLKQEKTTFLFALYNNQKHNWINQTKKLLKLQNLIHKRKDSKVKLKLNHSPKHKKSSDSNSINSTNSNNSDNSSSNNKFKHTRNPSGDINIADRNNNRYDYNYNYNDNDNDENTFNFNSNFNSNTNVNRMEEKNSLNDNDNDNENNNGQTKFESKGEALNYILHYEKYSDECLNESFINNVYLKNKYRNNNKGKNLNRKRIQNGFQVPSLYRHFELIRCFNVNPKKFIYSL